MQLAIVQNPYTEKPAELHKSLSAELSTAQDNGEEKLDVEGLMRLKSLINKR